MITNHEYFKTIQQDPAFALLAEPVTPETRLIPSEYVIRHDGTLIFLETLQTDAEGKEWIIGNPVRFPKKPDNPLNIGKVDMIFGAPAFNIMKILGGGKMSDSHHTQKEAIRNILESQSEGDWKIHPFTPAILHIGSRFDRSEFAFHFPVHKTLLYNLDMKVPNIERAVAWAQKETGLTVQQLGLSGSSSVGIIDPAEDVDLCFMATCEKLVEIKNLVHEGVLSGRFTPMEEYGHVWPLRCIIDNFELCPFFMPSDYEMDHAHIELLDPMDDLKVQVVNDDFNMLSPIHFVVEDEQNRPHEMVITNGFNRGHFFKGETLQLKDVHKARVTTRKRKFETLLIRAWNGAEKV